MKPDRAYFDGACGPPNPGGVGGWGYIIFAGDSSLLARDCGRMRARPDMTNNVAEYAAAGAAILCYRELGRPGPLIACGDSKLVIMQMSGRWRLKAGAYLPVAQRLAALIRTCSFEIEWRWVPREENTTADALSQRGQAGKRPKKRKKRRRPRHQDSP